MTTEEEARGLGNMLGNPLERNLMSNRQVVRCADLLDEYADILAAQATHEPSETDERIQAWETIAKHPIFAPCYPEERPLIESIVDRLDRLAELEQTVNELAPAPAAHEPSEAEVEAAAAGIWRDVAAHPDWMTWEDRIEAERRHKNDPSWGRMTDTCRKYARAALIAARQVGTQPEAEER
ncbi:hypothetical protein [Microbacterium sp. KR10-403]|uniref:hypothetical protein n=1 Tax=Microbacterium sp. KR10-403 TaxID=3158581 RepID=UPI0032E44EE3